MFSTFAGLRNIILNLLFMVVATAKNNRSQRGRCDAVHVNARAVRSCDKGPAAERDTVPDPGRRRHCSWHVEVRQAGPTQRGRV